MPKVWARLQSLGRSDWFVEFPSSYTAANKPITIGRNPTSTLCLTDNMTVSNKHVVLEQKLSETGSGRVVVVHESSSNGTVINGVQYQKGQSIELAPGAVVCFPCEDTAHKLDFTFEFHVLETETEGMDKNKTKPQLPTAEWATLQEQCDELAKEAARLAASVYSNSDKIRQLADTLTPSDGATFKDPLEEAARSMLTLLKVAEERLRTLGDEQTAEKIDHRKWELTLSRLGIDIPPQGNAD